MTLPWIVVLAALLFLVLWQSGLFERSGKGRTDRPRKLPPKDKAEPNRLQVFEEYLRDLTEDKDNPSEGGPKASS